jgi:catechol 2,3-dioxygenase-like lactoylglutathione lyase family enzyme
MLSTAPIYTYVPVRDLERCRRFYEEKLGLGPGEPSGPGLTFRCGNGTAFFMYPSPGAGSNESSCAFWQVNDAQAVVDWLKGRGVVFETYPALGMQPGHEIHVGGGAKAAWFKDTEGNIMAIVEAMSA